jgi:hypothetical protein
MKTLNSTEFIKMIKKNRKGYKIVIEDRIKLGYNTYGIVNQGEFINYMNPHDNCLWDAIIPGYNYQMSDNKKFTIKNILGYVYIPDGNHKIIINIGLNNFNTTQFMDDIHVFLSEYSRLNNIGTKLILF